MQNNDLIISQIAMLIKLLKSCSYIIKDKSHKYRMMKLSNALDIIKNYDSVITIDNVNEMLQIPGIGIGTITRIKEILTTGTLSEINELKNICKDNNLLIEQLSKIININNVKAKQLIKEFNIVSIDDLIKRVDSGIIDVNDKIKIGLKYYNKYEMNIPRNEINKIYNIIDEKLYKLDDKLLFYICGSYRRNKPISNDIDILLIHTDCITQYDVIDNNILSKVVNCFKQNNFIIDDLTDASSGTKYMGFCKLSIHYPIRRIDIQIVGIESFIPALVYFTGSYEFNRTMRKKAKLLNYKLNEYGLINKKTKQAIIITSEQQLFEILNMPYLTPEQR